MTHAVDTVLVALILAVAAFYAAATLGPRALRRRLLVAMSAGLRHLPYIWGARALAARAARAAEKTSSCGGCDGCGSAPAAGNVAPSSEVRVPVTHIGRRASR